MDGPLNWLIALDGTPLQNDMAVMSARLCNKEKDKIFLLRVHDLEHIRKSQIHVDAASTEDLYVQMDKLQLKGIREYLHKLEAKMVSLGFNVTPIIRNGDPKWVICDTIRKNKIDMCVLAHHTPETDKSEGVRKRDTFTKKLMGSVARYVMDHSSCTTMIIKSSEHPHLKNDPNAAAAIPKIYREGYEKKGGEGKEVENAAVVEKTDVAVEKEKDVAVEKEKDVAVEKEKDTEVEKDDVEEKCV
eukprot:TRINITY_DN298_c0_g1_i1.p1 TRINITY_DN298_c0_g1~~TRINITY_DN298_c0_g1_i1.p1  ORF type:complete len:258 (+),score=85.64 TRINITY_DN298_c0_g1_i1:43-774(+)